MSVSVVRFPSDARWSERDARAVWDNVVREGFSEEVALERKWGGGEGVSHEGIWVG